MYYVVTNSRSVMRDCVPMTTLKMRLRKRRNKRAERLATYELWDRLVALVGTHEGETTERTLEKACGRISTLASNVALLESLDRKREGLLVLLEESVHLAL